MRTLQTLRRRLPKQILVVLRSEARGRLQIPVKFLYHSIDLVRARIDEALEVFRQVRLWSTGQGRLIADRSRRGQRIGVDI